MARDDEGSKACWIIILRLGLILLDLPELVSFLCFCFCFFLEWILNIPLFENFQIFPIIFRSNRPEINPAFNGVHGLSTGKLLVLEPTFSGTLCSHPVACSALKAPGPSCFPAQTVLPSGSQHGTLPLNMQVLWKTFSESATFMGFYHICQSRTSKIMGPWKMAAWFFLLPFADSLSFSQQFPPKTRVPATHWLLRAC